MKHLLLGLIAAFGLMAGQADAAGSPVVTQPGSVVTPQIGGANVTSGNPLPVTCITGCSGGGGGGGAITAASGSYASGALSAGSVVDLGTGASPGANTTNGILKSINTQLGSPFQAGGSIGNTSFAATQATAANLNATIVGLGAAGTPSGGVISVQGVGGGTPQPVSGTFWQATQPVSGTFWQATQPVSLAALPSLATGANVIGAVTQSGTWNIGSITTLPALATGANVIGALTANQSVNHTQINGVTVATGNGVAGTGVQRVTIASDNSAVPVSGSFFQATQPISAAALPLPSGAATSANQTNASQKTQIVDGSGNVIASTSNNLNVQCANCSGSGVSTGDASSFTAGVSLFAGGGGFYQTTPTSNALTTGQQGLFQVTANRALFTNLRSAAGTELGVAAAPLQVSLANTASNGTNVNVNCVVGCAGGAQSNATSGLATSADNGKSVSWLYGFNGSTWDQLRVDGADNLNVNLQTALPAGANAIGSITNTSFAVTQATAGNLNATDRKSVV